MGGVVGAIANPFVAAQSLGLGSITGGGNLDLSQTLGTKNGYQATMAPGTEAALTAGQTGYTNAAAGQQQLIAALQAQAAGQGANPAQAMLNQATNQNIAQNTGMISSQKGINPALAVRQASQNAAATGQQAAGQAASMQAQQQIAAQNAQASVYSNMANQALNQQNIAQQGYYAPQSINAGVAAGNQQAAMGITGGLMSGAGTAAMAFLAHGGVVPHYADGGTIGSQALDPVSNAERFFQSQEQGVAKQSQQMANSNPMKGFTGGGGGGGSSGMMAGGPGDAMNMGSSMPMIDSGVTMMAAHGGRVPAMVSPGEKVLSPNEVKELSHGDKDYREVGKTVPGKAKVKGDSYENDTVPANLESGGIVIPRHITQGENPGEMAKKFVEEQLAKNSKDKRNFADGGEVPDYLKSNEDFANQNIKNITDAGVANAQAGTGMEQLPDKAQQFDQRVSEYAKQNNIDLNDPRNKQGVEQLVLNQFKGENNSQKWQQQDIANKAAQDAKFQQEKSDVLGIPQAPPQQSVANAQSLAQANQTPVGQGNGTPNPFGPYQIEMMKGLGMQQQAIGLQAQGEKQLAAGQLDVLQRQQADMQKLNQDYEQRYQDIDKETQAAAQALKDSKIDPNHYWADKSTPQKFAAGIGLILGGIGAGMTHTENAALKYINNQIDRDIQSQTQNMDKQKNLMSFNMQRLGNLRAAQAATAAMHLQTFQNELQQEQAKAQDPMIQARATQALAQVQQQKAEFQRQATLFSALGKAQAGGGSDNGAQVLQTMRMIDPKRAEEMEKHYIPGVGFGSVQVPDKVREEIAGRHELEIGLQKLSKFAQQHQGSLDPATMNEGKALANQVQDAYRRANGQGVFREAEADFVKGVIADDPTAFLAKYRTLPKYRSAIQQNKAALNSKLQAYGFQPTRDLSQYEGAPVK